MIFYLKVAKIRRNNIAMVKKGKPKKVVSSNDRKSFAKCNNDRRYKRRRGGCQRCRVLKSLFKQVYSTAKKLLTMIKESYFQIKQLM